MKRIGLILAAICLVLTYSSSTSGTEMPAAPTVYLLHLNTGSSAFLDSLNQDKETYNNCPISKAGDGALNAVSAWTDIPAEISYETADNNILSGLTFGLGRGVISGFTREAAGLVDLATCAFPPYNQPLVEPEYAVKHPDKDGLKITILSW